MATFTYKFEELPLVITNGIEAALVNGEAEIEVYPDGNWCAVAIAVEGYRKATKEETAKGARPYICTLASLAAGNELDFLISQRLEGEWRDRVQDAVIAQLEALHAEAA